MKINEWHICRYYKEIKYKFIGIDNELYYFEITRKCIECGRTWKKIIPFDIKDIILNRNDKDDIKKWKDNIIISGWIL